MLAPREDEVVANLAIHAQKPGKAGARAMVFFAAEPKVGIGTIRDLTAHCRARRAARRARVRAVDHVLRARIDELARDADVPITACELPFDQLQINLKHIDVPPRSCSRRARWRAARGRDELGWRRHPVLRHPRALLRRPAQRRLPPAA